MCIGDMCLYRYTYEIYLLTHPVRVLVEFPCGLGTPEGRGKVELDTNSLALFELRGVWFYPIGSEAFVRLVVTTRRKGVIPALLANEGNTRFFFGSSDYFQRVDVRVCIHPKLGFSRAPLISLDVPHNDLHAYISFALLWIREKV